MATIEELREIVGNDSSSLVELERLMDENSGELTPELVVAAATPADSPLHKHFEWDNTKAADAWRKQQARALIQSFDLHIIDKGGEHRIRYFTNVVVRDENVYKRTEEVLTVEALREQRRMKLVRELNRVRSEMATFSEFAQAVEKLDETIESLDAKRKAS